MLRFAGITLGLGVFGALAAATGGDILAVAAYATAGAYYWAAGRPGQSLALAATAPAAPVALTQSLALGAVYALAGAFGVATGAMARRGWPFGRIVFALSAAAFALVAVSALVSWDEIQAQFNAMATARIEQLRSESPGNGYVESVAGAAAWIREHWAQVYVGMAYGFLLLLAAAMVTVLNTALRQAGAPGPAGNFATMRVSEWLVWAAIALALLWFVEQRWPNEALRTLTWNGAIALAFVYWLNGFSILCAALAAFHAGAAVYALLFLAVFLFTLHHFVAMIGLFDTWWDFRKRFNRWAELRRLGPQSGGGEEP